MSNTKIKSSQFHGVVGHGTDGYFLVTNGDGSMSWISNVVNPVISSLSYPGSATAADPAGGETITITGTGFKTGAAVTVGGTAAPSVSYVSATSLTITTPAKAAGDYDVVVTNTDGGTATSVNGISFNGIPSWTTAAGTLGTFASDTTISTITLQASEPDAGTITFSITNGALPTGLSLTGADIDGTTTLETADTLYTFTVTATDDETQTTPRTFTITVTKQFISTENFTINTYTGNGSTQSIEGKIGTAADFNGSSSSRINLGSSNKFQGNEISFSFWVNYNTVNGNPILSNYNGGSYVAGDFYINYNSTGFMVQCWDGSGFQYRANISISANTWYHVVYTKTNDTTGGKFYVNGSEISGSITSGTSSGGTILGTGDSFYLGNHLANADALNGKLDQVRIFNKELSSSEVTTLYGESNTSTTKSTTDIFDDGSGIALYEFEEGAKDTGGVNGYIGSGGIFNGSSSYIETGLTANLTSFSWSGWVNPSIAWSGDIAFLVKGFYTGATNTNYAYLGYTGGSFRFQFRDNTTTSHVSSSVTPAVGQWSHIVATIDNGSAIKIYVNGVETGSDTNTRTISNASPFSIGGAAAVFSHLNGKIDQVRIFDKALSSSEVTTLYGETSASATKSTTDIFSDSSGIALYELEGNANNSATYIDNVHTTNLKINLNTLVEDSYSGGSTWSDLTTNGNDGTIYGATVDGDSLKFGSGDYVNIPDTADIVNSNFTIEAWFKLDSTTNQWNAIVGKGTSDNSEELCLLVRPGNNAIYFDWGTGSQYVQPSYTWQANVWYHFAMTFGTNGIYFWVNGQKITGQSSNPGSTTSLTDDLRIGSARNNTLSMYGNISQFRYYDSVLADSTIVSNYNSSSNPAFLNGTATNVSYAYDGTPTNVSFVGTSFQPDLVWIKERSSTSSHALFDSIRGVNKVLASDLTAAEDTSNNTLLTDFDANGFTVGNNNRTNQSGITHVAWCWKAASSDSTNTDGTITSTVRANQDAGFSIVKWTGTGAINTIGHGLNSAPELILIKPLDTSADWQVYAEPIGNNNKLALNTTSASSSTTRFDSTSPTSSVFTFRDVGISGDEIAYCFTSITGYQKIGSYSGSGAAGNKQTIGFQPRFLMVKLTNGSGSWWIFDSARTPNNPRNLTLRADTSNTDYTLDGVDFESDGFSFNSLYFNESGSNFIYLAIK